MEHFHTVESSIIIWIVYPTLANLAPPDHLWWSSDAKLRMYYWWCMWGAREKMFQGGTKVLLVGGWCHRGHDYAVMFGNRQVPATLFHAGVLRCLAPRLFFSKFVLVSFSFLFVAWYVFAFALNAIVFSSSESEILFSAHSAGSVHLRVFCDGMLISKSAQFTYFDPGTREERILMMRDLSQRLAYLQSCLTLSAESCVR